MKTIDMIVDRKNMELLKKLTKYVKKEDDVLRYIHFKSHWAEATDGRQLVRVGLGYCPPGEDYFVDPEELPKEKEIKDYKNRVVLLERHISYPDTDQHIPKKFEHSCEIPYALRFTKAVLAAGKVEKLGQLRVTIDKKGYCFKHRNTHIVHDHAIDIGKRVFIDAKYLDNLFSWRKVPSIYMEYNDSDTDPLSFGESFGEILLYLIMPIERSN
jgi:hypothetical protein